MGIEPTVSEDKAFTAPIVTLTGLAHVHDISISRALTFFSTKKPWYKIANRVILLLYPSSEGDAPRRMQKGRSVSRAALAKNLDFFSLQPLVLLSSCLVPIERSNDTKHVWGLRAYAHPLAGRPADRIGHIALRDIIVVNEPVTTKSQQLSFKMFPPPPSQGGSVTTDVHEFRHVHVPVNIRGFVNIGRKSADKRNLQQRHLEEMLVVTP